LLQRSRFNFFTNNSRFTPEDHTERLRAVGSPVSPEHAYTSALATARFIETQKPGSSAYVIGDRGLVEALWCAGCRITKLTPEVLGDTTAHHYEQIRYGRSARGKGRRVSRHQPDVTGPTERGFHPACGAVAALMEKAIGRQLYFIGFGAACVTRTRDPIITKLRISSAPMRIEGSVPSASHAKRCLLLHTLRTRCLLTR